MIRSVVKSLIDGVGQSPVSSEIIYLLRDEFITDLTAGSVDGTAAEPGPGTRKDVNNNTSISAAALVVNSVTDIEYFDNTITRTAGRIYIANLSVSADTDWDVVSIGFDDAKVAIPDRHALQFAASTILNAVQNGTTIAIADFSGKTVIKVLFLLWGTGCSYYTKYSSDNWILRWVSLLNNTVSLFAGIGGSGGAPTITMGFHRVPVSLSRQQFLLYDSFTRANGALGNSESSGPDSQPTPSRSWIGATWTIASNVAVNMPTQGVELLTNGDFATWTGDDPDNWVIAGEVGADPEVSEVGSGQGHGGVGTGLCNLYSSATFSAPEISQDSLSSHTFYQISVTIDTANSLILVVGLGSTAAEPRTTLSGVGTYVFTEKSAVLTTINIRGSDLPTDMTIDDISAKALTLSSLFATIETNTADVMVDVDIVIDPDGTQAGVVLNLDDAASPANFLICHHDGTNAKLEKCVAGTYSTLIDTATAFSAGATSRVIKDDEEARVFYNNAVVGTVQTVSDAGIIDNTLHGMFSTAANQLDNFQVFSRGVDGAYSELDRY
jgi:hypothetical protein